MKPYSVWLLCRGSRHIDGASLDIIRIASEMNGAERCHFTAVVFGPDITAFPIAIDQAVRIPSSANVCADTQARSLATLANRLRPDVILAPANVWGRTVMSIAAALLNTGLTADCVTLALDEAGQLYQTRPAYGGKLLADILIHTRPQMATVRTRIGGNCSNTRLKELSPVTVSEAVESYIGAVLLRRTPNGSNTARLAESPIVVAGGLGVGSRENFQVIYELAACLGGAPAASRAAVNEGFAPYACQVGQSGHTVAPKVYLAIGISGAVQHLSGIQGAGKIIAVNPDPKAPIFEYADVGIVSSWQPFAEALLKQLNKTVSI